MCFVLNIRNFFVLPCSVNTQERFCHGTHAAYDHKRDQQPNDSHHRGEIQQWLVAFIHSNFQV